MGKMKEFWMEKCDEVIDEYYRGVITYKEARSKLKTLNSKINGLCINERSKL